MFRLVVLRKGFNVRSLQRARSPQAAQAANLPELLLSTVVVFVTGTAWCSRPAVCCCLAALSLCAPVLWLLAGVCRMLDISGLVTALGPSCHKL